VVGVGHDDVVDRLALRRLQLREELLVRGVVRLLELDAELLLELLGVLRIVVLGPVVEVERALDLLLLEGRARDGRRAAAPAACGPAARGRRDRERARAEQLAPVEDAQTPPLRDVGLACDCVQIPESCA
jgi:hypothetical protein